MNKFCKLFIAVLAVIALGSAAFAQGGHYNMYPQTPKHAWQEKIHDQAIEHDSFAALWQGVTGKWSATQEEAGVYHNRMVRLIKANPEQYFHRTQYTANVNDRMTTEEKLAAENRAAQKNDQWKAAFLQRYNHLQGLIDANFQIFPKYVLHKGLDLTQLDDATMAELEKIFKGTNRDNTPGYSYSEVVVRPYNHDGIRLNVNNKVKLLIFVSPDMTQRRIEISWK